MRIAILGAGFAGLAAGYDLSQRHDVAIFEKSPSPGGAAGGFQKKGWEWHLDYAYHHWFTSDRDIFDFCKKIGWNDIITKRTTTASLYGSEIYKLDSPLDLLQFPQLPFFDRVRTGMVLAALKFGPSLASYHTTSAHDWAVRFMGKRSWDVMWRPLMEKKYGAYAPLINAMFFWARINKRTPRLAYPAGGFQALANYTAGILEKKGVHFRFSYTVSSVEKKRDGFYMNGEGPYDAVISTLPTPVFLSIEKNVLPSTYRTQIGALKYLGAHALIYESNEPLIEPYWLNIADKKNPWMVMVGHTNFMDPKHFGGRHLTYVAKYTNSKLPVSSYPVFHKGETLIQDAFIPYAQPLYTTNYSRIFPQTVSPVKGLYFATMEQTYPYDRGTNYAVKVGREAARCAEERT